MESSCRSAASIMRGLAVLWGSVGTCRDVCERRIDTVEESDGKERKIEVGYYRKKKNEGNSMSRKRF